MEYYIMASWKRYKAKRELGMHTQNDRFKERDTLVQSVSLNVAVCNVGIPGL